VKHWNDPDVTHKMDNAEEGGRFLPSSVAPSRHFPMAGPAFLRLGACLRL